MAEPVAYGSFKLSIVAGILTEDNSESKGVKEVFRSAVRQRRSIVFTVTGHSLAERRVIVLRLIQAGIECRPHKRYRLNRIVEGQAKFVCGAKAAKLVSFARTGLVDSLDFQLAGKICHRLVQRTLIVCGRKERSRFHTGRCRRTRGIRPVIGSICLRHHWMICCHDSKQKTSAKSLRGPAQISHSVLC